jgi:hypothetical protein
LALPEIGQSVAGPVIKKRFVDLKSLVFAGFLYAGAFKGDDLLLRLPVDLTLVLAVMTVVLVAMSFVRSDYNFPDTLAWMLVLFTLCLIPVLWTEWSGYAVEKVIRMFTLTFLAAIAPMMLFKFPIDLRCFFNAVILLGLVMCAQGMVNLIVGIETLRLEAFSGDTIMLGRIAGQVSILLIIKATEAGWFQRVSSLLLLSVSTIILVGAGSRGPMIAFLSTLLAMGLLTLFSKRQAKTAFLFSGGLVAFLIIGSLAYAPQQSRDRLVEMFQGRIDLEMTGRTEYFDLAVSNILVTPQGTGWGGFERVATDSYRSDVNRYYPHNLFLEAFLEGGWIVGVFLTVILATVIFRTALYYIRSHLTEALTLFALMFFITFVAMFSNDWNDNRDLFAVVSLSLMFTRNEKI